MPPTRERLSASGVRSNTFYRCSNKQKLHVIERMRVMVFIVRRVINDPRECGRARVSCMRAASPRRTKNAIDLDHFMQILGALRPRESPQSLSLDARNDSQAAIIAVQRCHCPRAFLYSLVPLNSALGIRRSSPGRKNSLEILLSSHSISQWRSSARDPIWFTIEFCVFTSISVARSSQMQIAFNV